MADLNDALERLISDPAFRQALGDDPEKALDGYDLSDEDRKMLSAQLSDDPGVRGGLEQRTSKSALAGLFGGGGAGNQESDLDFVRQLAEDSDGGAPLEEQIGFAYKNITFDDGEDPTLAFNPKEFPVSKTNPPPAPPAGGDHEIEMSVVAAQGEPDEPSDLTAGGDTGEGSSGVDGTGKPDSGKYVVTSVQHGAASGSDGGESLGSTPESAPGGEDSSNWIRVKGNWGEPDEPSDITAGRDTDGTALGVDGMVGGKTGVEAAEDGGSSDGVFDPNTWVVPSKPPAGAGEVGDTAEGSPLGEAEIEDGTSKTAMVSESQSGSDGDSLGGEITPKDESEMSSPYIKKASFQNTSPEGPDEVAGAGGDDQGAAAPGHEKQMDIHSWSWGQTGGAEDPEKPIIIGTLYNPPGAQAGSSAPADLSDGGVHELPGALVFEAPAEPIVILEPPPPPESTGAGLRSDGELVQDEEGPGEMAPTGRGAEEGIEGTDLSTGYTSEPGDIGDDLPDDPPED